MTVADAIAAMRAVLMTRPRTIVLGSAWGIDGCVGPADAHVLGPRLPSHEELLRVSRFSGKSGALFGSRAVSAVQEPSAEDIRLTQHLAAAAESGRLCPFMHVIVASDGVRALAQIREGDLQPALRNIS